MKEIYIIEMIKNGSNKKLYYRNDIYKLSVHPRLAARYNDKSKASSVLARISRELDDLNVLLLNVILLDNALEEYSDKNKILLK